MIGYLNNLLKMKTSKIGIIGGGPAALTTAIKLKRLKHDITVFEATNYDKITVGEHLAAEAIHEFKKLHIPISILKNNSIPCTEVKSTWASNNIQFNESIFNPFGNGYILSRPKFDADLLKHCTTIGIKTHINTRVSKITTNNTGWKLHYDSKNIDFDFIVDGSGRNSKFFSDKNSQKKDTLIGITAQLSPLKIAQISSSHLLIEPTKNGWWYSVQNASNNLICTFMTDAKIWQEQQNNKLLFLKEQLKNSSFTNKRASNFSNLKNYTVQAAHSRLAKKIVGYNWLKVGDAAQSFDPLSSAGIIKGLKMGQLAADSIHNYLNGTHKDLIIYKAIIQEQYKEYLQKRSAYYNQEQRWNTVPFWYKKMDFKQINRFTIVPVNRFKVLEDNLTEKISFLENQLPEINFTLLIKSIQKHSLIKDAVNTYCKNTLEQKINPWLFYALEGLKILEIIK